MKKGDKERGGEKERKEKKRGERERKRGEDPAICPGVRLPNTRLDSASNNNSTRKFTFFYCFCVLDAIHPRSTFSPTLVVELLPPEKFYLCTTCCVQRCWLWLSRHSARK